LGLWGCFGVLLAPLGGLLGFEVKVSTAVSFLIFEFLKVEFLNIGYI